MRTAKAYLNYGRWVADCPEPGCRDARLVYPVHPQTGTPLGARVTEDVCANGHPFRIDMPDPELEARIVAAVAERAEDADKAWYPDGHPWAETVGLPTGQSVDDLLAENRVVEKFRAELDARRQDTLRELLDKAGVTVRADGTFEGKI